MTFNMPQDYVLNQKTAQIADHGTDCKKEWPKKSLLLVFQPQEAQLRCAGQKCKFCFLANDPAGQQTKPGLEGHSKSCDNDENKCISLTSALPKGRQRKAAIYSNWGCFYLVTRAFNLIVQTLCNISKASWGNRWTPWKALFLAKWNLRCAWIGPWERGNILPHEIYLRWHIHSWGAAGTASSCWYHSLPFWNGGMRKNIIRVDRKVLSYFSNGFYPVFVNYIIMCMFMIIPITCNYIYIFP